MPVVNVELEDTVPASSVAEEAAVQDVSLNEGEWPVATLFTSQEDGSYAYYDPAATESNWYWWRDSLLALKAQAQSLSSQVSFTLSETANASIRLQITPPCS